MQSTSTVPAAAPAARADRRLAAVVIAGVVCVALGICSVTLGGRPGGIASFLLFLISLPWTVPVYVMTMVFDVTSPIAIGALIVLVTLAMWRYGSRVLMRTCVTPRER